ncbi:uncharacterized protein LOC135844994 [Planococcus citri]|uniref:uncharacterized protein LOC135844994 n=1 Tax=Planococcus citri TaxID=170843 RepID=UPI0031F9BDDC
MNYLIFIVILIIPTIIAENSLKRMKKYVDEEYENVMHLLELLIEQKMHVMPDDPKCLSPTIKFGAPKIREYLNRYTCWRYAEDERLNAIRDSEKMDDHQIEEELQNLNITLHRLRDIYESLHIAKSTVHYIRNELEQDIRKHNLEEQYDIEGEFKMECDSLKGMFISTAQLARRLVPPSLKHSLSSINSPIIRLKLPKSN